MARIRSVHPGLFTDEAFASLSMASRVLFIGLWCEADDMGVFEWKALTLKMRLFPGDTVDANDLLSELAARDMIRSFEASGKQYGAIRNFGRYQRPRSPKALYPCPAEMADYLAIDGPGVPGALTHPRDVTATDRKRRQRQKGISRHASSVTISAIDADQPGRFPQFSEVSRQMEDGGYSSVAKATGETAPGRPPADTAAPDWRTKLFRDGLTIVGGLTGKPEGASRSLIGKWLRSTQDDARRVLRTLEDARDNNPADPVAWIEGALRSRAPQRTDSLAFLTARA